MPPEFDQRAYGMRVLLSEKPPNLVFFERGRYDFTEVFHHLLLNAGTSYEHIAEWVGRCGGSDIVNTMLLSWHPAGAWGSPLMWAIQAGRDDVARWLILLGAKTDLSTNSEGQVSVKDCLPQAESEAHVQQDRDDELHRIAVRSAVPTRGTAHAFALACYCSSCEFVAELADLVPPNQLEQIDFFGRSPMRLAYERNDLQTVPIVTFLITRGVRVVYGDFPPVLTRKYTWLEHRWTLDYKPKDQWDIAVGRRNRLRSWAANKLHVREVFTNLVVGCGVHGSHDVAPGERSELRKLRGDTLTAARMHIAGCLGVPVGVDVGNMRRAVAQWDIARQRLDSVEINREALAILRVSRELRV
jgi:hypothetical protein